MIVYLHSSFLASFFISFFFLLLSTLTIFITSYVRKPPVHCQPSNPFCFQAFIEDPQPPCAISNLTRFCSCFPLCKYFLCFVLPIADLWKIFMLGTTLHLFLFLFSKAWKSKPVNLAPTFCGILSFSHGGILLLR